MLCWTQVGGSQLKRWINWQAGNKDNLITLQAPEEEKHGNVVFKICSEPNRKLLFADFESSFLRKTSLPPQALPMPAQLSLLMV